MTDFVNVCKLDDIPAGGMKEVEVDGKKVLLARASVDATDCFAVGHKCTHLKADLSGGNLKDNVVTCPRHGAQYDVSTGEIVRWVQHPGFMKTLANLMPKGMRKALPRYEVRIEGDDVAIRL